MSDRRARTAASASTGARPSGGAWAGREDAKQADAAPVQPAERRADGPERQVRHVGADRRQRSAVARVQAAVDRRDEPGRTPVVRSRRARLAAPFAARPRAWLR